MATVTSLAGGTLPAWTSNLTTRYARDTILTETSASYSWTSSFLNKVVLLGSFTYPGGAGTDPTGTIDQALFDISNDGTTDLTITFSSPKSILSASLFDFDSGLMGALLDEANTLTLAGTTDTNGANAAFHANGSGLAGLTNQASDDLTITGAGLFTADNDGTIADGVVTADDTVTINSTLGAVSVSGDVFDLGSFGGASISNTRTITYGNDTFVDTSAQSALTHVIAGDSFETGLSSEFFILNFGNDTVTGGANSLEVFADAFEINGDDLELNGGADSITASDQGDVIVGDFGDFRVDIVLPANNNAVSGGADTIEAGTGDDLVIGDVKTLGEFNTLTAGDDSIQGEADNDTLIGDVQEIGANSIFSGGDDQMAGGTGDDLLIGDYEALNGGLVASGGNDTLAGGSGDDTLMGQEGNDDLRGGGNDDLLIGGAGNDTVDGANGEDTVDFSGSSAGVNLTLNGATDATATGEGTDTVRNIEHIIGSALNDTLIGDGEDNILEGGEGDDALDGGGGSADVASYANAAAGVIINLNDTSQQNTGGAGLDRLVRIEHLVGSDFDDELSGDDQDNEITGGAGNDIILVRADSETFTALGVDTLLGGVGDDTIGYSGSLFFGAFTSGSQMDGGDDTDTFTFQASTSSHVVDLGAETFQVLGSATVVAALVDFENVSGGFGNDEIIGNDLDNVLSGGSANDTLIGGIGADTLRGEVGSDTASYLGSDAAVSVNLATGVHSGGHADGDVLSSISNIIGSGFGDALTGDVTTNMLNGEGGDDLLDGGAEDDTLEGGAGFDTLIGGAGADDIDGGDDIDVVDYEASAVGVNVNLSTSTGLQGDAAGDTYTDVEGINGSTGDDTLTGTGGDNTLNGNTGADVMRGLGGVDALNGDAGTDDISGGNGADTINGGTEADTLRGQGDDDEISGGEGDDELLGGAGADTLFGDDGADSIIGQGQADSLEGGIGNDTLKGGSGNDTLLGQADDDQLFGNGNNDSLDGGMGNDTLQGAAGLDTLLGGEGDDLLTGGEGADLLDGGTGNDTMNGGTLDGARDTFVFAVGYDLDRVNGFEQMGNDELMLDDALWASSGVLSEQAVIDLFGMLNGTGTILTLDFGNGDILEVQNAGGLDETTLGTDVVIF